MKKLMLFLIVVIVFVVVQWSRIQPVAHDGLSGSYLGVGQDFGFDLRVDNHKGEIEWFLDVKKPDVIINSIQDQVKIQLVLETGDLITLLSTEDENVIYAMVDHDTLSQTVNSMPVLVRISYNEMEEEIPLNIVAIK